jgi:outer membrane protein assembly factor BamB
MKTKLSEVVVSLFVFMVTVDSMAVEWRQFRGPGGQGATSENNLPRKWSDTENIAWKTVCISNKGQILWDEHVEPKLPESKTVRDHGYAGPTPATDGQHLYVFFGKSGVLKFDLDGRQLWRADVGEETHRWGCGTSPVLHGGLVIVNASLESGSLVAINKDDGREVWRAGGMVASWNTPHLVDIGNRQELVVSVKNKILAFDPATGDELWQCAGIEDYVCPGIVSHAGVVYVIGGRQSKAIAIRAVVGAT